MSPGRNALRQSAGAVPPGTVAASHACICRSISGVQSMQSKVSFAALALALVAAPLSAQNRSFKIPPGQLPPAGLCRVWIDGVPPGRQPPVTSCAVAEANRVANSRVIYGDRTSFPGNGKNKFNTSNGDVGRACSAWDAVVVNGNLVNGCRDDRVLATRRV